MAFILATPRRCFFTPVYRTTLLGVLLSAKEIHTYLSLEVLLQILRINLVITATNDCSFNALRYLKTYLRFTTKEDRLNGLALLYVHH